MRSRVPALACATLFWTSVYGQAPQPSFEVASVKPASPSVSAISCSGGPGTSDPTLWKCTSVPLGLLISQAYGFEAYQFRPNDPCCRERFDLTAKVPEGTTKEQFHRMIQNLLEDRFRLKFHLVKKEMPIYELSVAETGLKMKESPTTASPPPADDPWAPPDFTIGKDGYPVFPAGRSGLAGPNGHYRWVAFNLPMQEIVKTLSFYLGRPVVDATGLTRKYDVDLRWWIDLAWVLERSGHVEESKDLPDRGTPGPPLLRAVQDQLGLKLTSRKGFGNLVAIDHLENVPAGN
jgi:uncharacterized protein (TIGR03435 family)